MTSKTKLYLKPIDIVGNSYNIENCGYLIQKTNK